MYYLCMCGCSTRRGLPTPELK